MKLLLVVSEISLLYWDFYQESLHFLTNNFTLVNEVFCFFKVLRRKYLAHVASSLHVDCCQASGFVTWHRWRAYPNRVR